MPPSVPEASALGVEVYDPSLPACAPELDPQSVAVDTLMWGLEAPWSVTFLPGGDALLTERPGRIRRWSSTDGLDPEPWAVVEGLSGDEVGLMGIVSRVKSDGRVDVYAAAVIDHTDGPWLIARAKGVVRRVARLITPDGGQPRSLQVLRYTVTEGDRTAGSPTSLLRVTPAGELHGGGALSIGPDGLLYLTNGDGAHPARAFDPHSAAGKVLRFTLDGDPAPLHADDPIPAVVGGIRNSQGLGWHPTTGELILIDHGPSGMPQDGGRVGNDELNVASFGDNLGWPVAAGASRGGGLVGATVEWTFGIAPAGLAVAPNPDGPWGSAVFVTGLKDGKLRRLVFDPSNPSRFRCQEPMIEGGFGRLRMVAVAPDGSLWIGTSNRDGRGGPREGDDLILRVRPRQSVASGAVE
jgi:glucose/arabinose dehydrogenase